MTAGDREARAWLSAWPLPRPRRWVEWVNEPQTEGELAALRRCVQRGCPYGDDDWVEQTARELGLETTLRPRGRPRKVYLAAVSPTAGARLGETVARSGENDRRAQGDMRKVHRSRPPEQRRAISQVISGTET
jgi:hypothetical protein